MKNSALHTLATDWKDRYVKYNNKVKRITNVETDEQERKIIIRCGEDFTVTANLSAQLEFCTILGQEIHIIQIENYYQEVFKTMEVNKNILITIEDYIKIIDDKTYDDEGSYYFNIDGWDINLEAYPYKTSLLSMIEKLKEIYKTENIKISYYSK